jgi:LuxR family maltose regulon positive regulatory protein
VQGHFTARKERRQRGGEYWIAYRKVDRKLRNAYLGMSPDLTMERLRAAAAALATAPADHPRADRGTGRVAHAHTSSAATKDSRQLLATKLFVPQARSDLVVRPRLDTQLEAGLAHLLTLISAPAGSGKTTLLGDWAQRHAASGQYGIAWVSLDASDSDLRTFVQYLTAALRNVTPAVGQGTRALLQSAQPFPAEALLRPLLNDLATLPRELVVVLDDYHLIDSPSVHQALQFMLDHLPPTLHLVIATRVDPPLPLARLRARGQLTEVRGADLRFTAGEAAEFLRRVMGLDLTEADLAALEARTEGWIAGLQLAARSLQGRDDSAAFVAAFSGSHHYVLDYLVEEVLQRQPPAVKQFLLRTSVLDRLTAPLCDMLLEQTGSAAMLRRLEQENLFLVPLDDAHTWYRYHHLFADVLHQRLREEQPELLPVLYGRASAWFEQHGSQAEAVRMALAAANVERAASLVEDVSEVMLLRGEMLTLLSWLHALPVTLIRTRPRLCVAEAWALAVWFDDRINEAEARLADAKRLVQEHQVAALPPTLDERILGDVAAIRATMAAKRGDVPGMITHSREALRRVPTENRALRALAGLNLGIAYRISGEVAAAREALAEAAPLKQSGGNVFVTVLAMVNLARLDMLEGRLHQAATRLQRAIQVGSTPAGTPLPIAGIAHLRLADVLYQWGDLTAAADHLARGFELGQDWSVAETTIDAYLTLARVHQARGDAEAARAAIVEAEQRASEQEPGHLVAQVSSARAWLSLAQGSLHLAAHWADARQADLAAAGEPGFRSHAAYIMVARVRIAQGRVEQALGLLERLLAAAQTGGLYGRMNEVLVLKAIALQAQGDTSAALLALQRALTLAEPGVRPLLRRRGRADSDRAPAGTGRRCRRALCEHAARGLRSGDGSGRHVSLAGPGGPDPT